MKSTPTPNIPLAEVTPGNDVEHHQRSSITFSKLLIMSTLLLIAAVGCSRFADLDDQDRLEMANSSCINCHTNEAIMIAMLGEVVPGDEGGGGG